VSTDANRPHRGTIFLEDARVIRHEAFAANQFILRVGGPECAQRAVAGSFAHIRCARDIPMRRPLSIMRADRNTGEVDFLYKVVGTGLAALSTVAQGDELSILGPIGNGFSPSADKPLKLMIGGGVGIPPMVFLANQLQKTGANMDTSLVLMGSEVPFPFQAVGSEIPVSGVPANVTAGMPDLEALGISSRLASLQSYAGCYQGYVTDLAKLWLQSHAAANLSQIEMFACGPEPMLKAAAKVAAEFSVPCQLCLEEYMACAVGGCAGCAVPIYANGETSMKRVCVDGPVFAATAVYPALWS
jgi:dihydroorotate dehydrogenase electron transfer subunit